VPSAQSGKLNLRAKTSTELVSLLSHPNDWYARQARRLLAERRDTSIVPTLTELLDSDDQRTALQALWTIYVTGAFDDRLAKKTLGSSHEYVRAWTVRLVGDSATASPSLQPKLEQLARNDPSVTVRSQLAASAKRWPANLAMPLVGLLLHRDEDIDDVHMPLLLWWAIEHKAVSDTSAVLQLFESPEFWKLPLVRGFITPRVARRMSAEGSDAGYTACARLLKLAPTDDDVDLVMSGMAEALSGQRLERIPQPIEAAFQQILHQARSAAAIELAVRMGSQPARALEFVADEAQPTADRVSVIQVLGETRAAGAIDMFLALIEGDEPEAIQEVALSNLGYFDAPTIAHRVIRAYPRLAASTRTSAIDLLCGRREWARELLTAVESRAVDPGDLTLSQLRQLVELDDSDLRARMSQYWGQIQSATPLEIQGRITAVEQLLSRAEGDAELGARVFHEACAKCHKLHGGSGEVGPDLTGAERKDRLKLITHVVDPNAMVREEYFAHVATTKDGRVVTGILANSAAETITLLDADNKHTILNRSEIDELRESAVSLMPERLLDTLTDQQIRDLFAFLRSDSAADGSGLYVGD
jgi:putative heme-binding domain-containing protein